MFNKLAGGWRRLASNLKTALQVADLPTCKMRLSRTSGFECVGDDLKLEGTRSFVEVLNVKDDEVAVFGWVVFPSKDVRDSANERVPKDPRMAEL